MTMVIPRALRPAIAPEHVPQKWQPVLRKRTCSNKAIERDDDSNKSQIRMSADRTRIGGRNGDRSTDIAFFVRDA
jgi:hypothetical protein